MLKRYMRTRWVACMPSFSEKSIRSWLAVLIGASAFALPFLGIEKLLWELLIGRSTDV
jgi:hypothetical protein